MATTRSLPDDDADCPESEMCSDSGVRTVIASHLKSTPRSSRAAAAAAAATHRHHHEGSKGAGHNAKSVTRPRSLEGALRAEEILGLAQR